MSMLPIFFLLVHRLASTSQDGQPVQTAGRLLALVFDGLRPECAAGR